MFIYSFNLSFFHVFKIAKAQRRAEKGAGMLVLISIATTAHLQSLPEVTPQCACATCVCSVLKIDRVTHPVNRTSSN